MATLTFQHSVDPQGLANYLLFRLQDVWPGAQAYREATLDRWSPAGDGWLQGRPTSRERHWPAFPVHYQTGPAGFFPVEVTVGQREATLHCTDQDLALHPEVAVGLHYVAWLPVLTDVRLEGCPSVGANTLVAATTVTIAHLPVPGRNGKVTKVKP